jgi:membrane protein DedA with SNARE-associated domain
MPHHPHLIDIAAKSFKTREVLISVAAVLATLGLCAAVIYSWDSILQMKQYGYGGVLLISILTGISIPIPVPGVLLVFTMGSILDPYLVGLFAGLGEALGSLVVYFSGYGGNKALIKIHNPLILRFEGWIHNKGALAIFFMSSITNPLFYPFTAIAGMMHYGIIRFFFYCWAGKTVKGIVIALLGYYGLGAVLNMIGVHV